MTSKICDQRLLNAMRLVHGIMNSENSVDKQKLELLASKHIRKLPNVTPPRPMNGKDHKIHPQSPAAQEWFKKMKSNNQSLLKAAKEFEAMIEMANAKKLSPNQAMNPKLHVSVDPGLPLKEKKD